MIGPFPAFICAVAVFVTGALSPFDGGVMVQYIGPDQIMPVSSVLGGVIGVLLMFWNRVVGVFRRIKAFRPRR